MDGRFESGMALAQETLDFQLSPSRSAKDANGVLDGLVATTKQACDDPSLLVTRDIAYGDRPRQRLDVYCPRSADAPLPCLVFVHGGFWQEGDKGVSGFAAQAFAALGWATIAVGYTLTPDVSLTELTEEVHRAVKFIYAQCAALGIDPNRIVLAGHSAGGHLAACVMADVLAGNAHNCVAGAVLISGVFELAPIAKSYVNDEARITQKEVKSLSPLRFAPASNKPIHLLIGADEPAAFQMQTSVLHDLWGPQVSKLTMHVAPGRDHFDVLDELKDPTGKTVKAILDMV